MAGRAWAELGAYLRTYGATTHFWGPVANWGFVVAGLADMRGGPERGQRHMLQQPPDAGAEGQACCSEKQQQQQQQQGVQQQQQQQMLQGTGAVH
ncbi:apoptosis-regulating basic protein, putative [Eimeria brunetti]|uniref:Mitochondrial pyruvate carrier n=1 Tax=Eimeria brunetti TaxID=51314 RepID=U6LHI7_9EIME|nr:apoptosis-regulating basic protein, putative [Eimeria brunetti]